MGYPHLWKPPIWHFKSHIFRYAWMKCSLSSAFLWAGSMLDRWLGLVLREMRPMLFFLRRIPEYPSKATTKVTGHYEEELLFSDLFSIWLMVQNSEYWTCEIPLVPHDIPKIITFFEWSPPWHTIYIYIYIFWHSIWHSFWHILWHNPTFYLILFFLAYVSAISSDILSVILSGISSEILSGQGPAGPTLILSLLFGSGGDDCDHKLAVEVWRRRRRRRRTARTADLKYPKIKQSLTWQVGPVGKKKMVAMSAVEVKLVNVSSQKPSVHDHDPFPESRDAENGEDVELDELMVRVPSGSVARRRSW